MIDLTTAISVVRESVLAILRIRRPIPGATAGGQPSPGQFQASIGGSAFCVVADRFLATAFHVLNAGQPRDESDRFFAFLVPGNGDLAFHFPVTGFPVERPDLDLAVLEIGPCATPGIHIPALPVSFTPRADGTRIVTVGFPAPEIVRLNVDPQGNYAGGHFFLKSHANEGIVSAQYAVAGVRRYEFNVGWHHGESGGPVLALERPSVAISLMQHYRNIQSPHGTVPGPHRGCALSGIQEELGALEVDGR